MIPVVFLDQLLGVMRVTAGLLEESTAMFISQCWFNCFRRGHIGLKQNGLCKISYTRLLKRQPSASVSKGLLHSKFMRCGSSSWLEGESWPLLSWR
jgi:hypothetical protein